MNKQYNFKEIEKKWQDFWQKNNSFKAKDFSNKDKFYGLIEFPYPSGHGLHCGHIRAYSSMDIIARKRRMEGFNVLFPIGYDAFGLPTENYALKHKIHPRKVTDDNIKTFNDQLIATGFSFDFSRVIDTTDPNYYKFTQYIFLKLFEHNLAYKSKTLVNFCPECKVVLANEESQGGKCDRCEHQVVQKEKDVWFLRITEYAQKLLDSLNDLDFPERIKTEQENWIGRSVGAKVKFPLSVGKDLEIFTTRPDTIFGATFMVIAPEHLLLTEQKDLIKNYQEISDYVAQAKSKTEMERVHFNKDKKGIKINGIKAINPLTKKEIDIFVADYVMISYGSGAVMAVPGHDQRDYEFAKKHRLPIQEVIKGGDLSQAAYTDTEGVLVNSDFLDGLTVTEAIPKILVYLEKEKIGSKETNYKMKDWAFNRQRYWGEPIPIIYCASCGVVPVPYKDLPVLLPNIKNIEVTDTGESPLANVPEFVNTICPKCGKKAKRETDTMPQWAGSSWYFLRFADPKNSEVFADYDKLKYWLQVDWYNGGMEHVTRHMIYSRFWNQFLHDIKLVPFKEPYKKRSFQGLILGSDNEKMSKSRGNVVDPMDIINNFGADTLRLFMMFMAEYDQPVAWNDKAIQGCRRFIERLWRLQENINSTLKETDSSVEVILHKTIKKVSEDIEAMKFNTAIAQLMILLNEIEKSQLTVSDYLTILKLVNPFCPHVTEELNSFYAKDTLVNSSWPVYNPKKLLTDECLYIIQINGKLKEKISIKRDLSDSEVEKVVFSDERIIKILATQKIKKVIVVKNRLVNIVV
ncbi:MAG: leucine--tRNA ligase [Erysipelotrichales bacterium]|nr:leucine--tRNA ligase [Erysipelotrichales bacterium]